MDPEFLFLPNGNRDSSKYCAPYVSVSTVDSVEENISADEYQTFLRSLAGRIPDPCWIQTTKYIYCIPRVQQCLSPRPNWVSPPLSRKRVCPSPTPPQTKGGSTHSPACEGLGSPNSDDWRKRLAFCLLCDTDRHTGKYG